MGQIVRADGKPLGMANPYQPTPWQVKFTYAFGIPAIIAMYLVYYQTDQSSKYQERLATEISQLSSEVRNLRETVHRADFDKQVIEKKYDNLINMMVRVCATTAETNTDRNACFEFAGTRGTIGEEEFGGIRPYPPTKQIEPKEELQKK